MNRVLRFIRYLRDGYRIRADLHAHEERRQRIIGILAERKGGNPLTIEGEYTVVDRFRHSGAL